MGLLLSKPTTLWWNQKSMFRVLKYRVVHLMFTTIRLVLIIVNDKHSIIKIWTVFDKCTSFLRNIYRYFTFHTSTNLYDIQSIYVYILND